MVIDDVQKAQKCVGSDGVDTRHFDMHRRPPQYIESKSERGNSLPM